MRAEVQKDEVIESNFYQLVKSANDQIVKDKFSKYKIEIDNESNIFKRNTKIELNEQNESSNVFITNNSGNNNVFKQKLKMSFKKQK
jgi:hypothetical protein